MSASPSSNPPKDDIDRLLDRLPIPPPVFAPRGLVLAAQLVDTLSTHAPGLVSHPLTISRTESLAIALHKSAHQNNPSGPLLPRHSEQDKQHGSAKRRVQLEEMSDEWCHLTTR